MAGVEICYLPVVMGSHLKDSVHLKAIKNVSGAWFWKALKSDHIVERMLLGTAQHRERPLSRTSVFETLIELRNNKMHSIINPPAEDDLGLDDEPTPRKRAKLDLAALPSVLTVEAPTIGDAMGMPIQVLPDQPSKPLWLELSAPVIEYLMSAVAYQINNAGIHRARPQHLDGAELGVTFEARRHAVRARKDSGHQKYFRVSELSAAVAAAEVWRNSEALPIQASERCSNDVSADVPPGVCCWMASTDMLASNC